MSAAQKRADRRRSGGAEICDINVFLPAGFALQSGEALTRPELALRIHGDIARPAICAAGGVSAGRVVADDGETRGWWRGLVGRGRAVDLETYCVIGFDFLPNPGEAAKTISTRDQARALAYALEALNVAKLKAFIGASYGGMIALAFAEAFPERLEKLCVVSAADRAHPAATALRGVQRRIIALAASCGAPREGVSLARQLAMTTYRTADEFALRFSSAPGAAAGDAYDVCDYLVARGEAYRMSPARYVTLSDSVDRHRIDPEKILADSLFLASRSDRLVPAGDIERLAGSVRKGRLVAFDSLYGHDAFLKEEAIIGPVLSSFIEE